MLTVWDAALEAVAQRIVDAIPDVPVETDRRAPVDVEDYPRLVVELEDEDARQEQGETFYDLTIAVSGYAKAPLGTDPDDADTAARRAVNALKARVLVALNGWQDAAVNISDVVEVSSERMLDAAENSAPAAGDFTSRFSVLVAAPAGNPWASTL